LIARAPSPLSTITAPLPLQECVAFPNGAHDDQVDAMTQALLRWHYTPAQQIIYYNEPYEISPI